MKYTVEYDREDLIWVARCDSFPSLAAHGHTPQQALEEILFVVHHANAEIAREAVCSTLRK